MKWSVSCGWMQNQAIVPQEVPGCSTVTLYYPLRVVLSAVIWCKSIYCSELSNFLGLTLKKKEDPHPLFLMIMQLMHKVSSL
jgi:hypothetical protein